MTCVGAYFISDSMLRNTIISKCDSSLDCSCFSNIVKYRFTKQELVAFNRFLKTLPIRDNVGILEFTDAETAQHISDLVSLCRKTTPMADAQSDQNQSTTGGNIEGENQINTKE